MAVRQLFEQPFKHRAHLSVSLKAHNFERKAAIRSRTYYIRTMMYKFFVSTIALSLLAAARSESESPQGPRAPLDHQSFLAELESHLRGRHLQTTGDQDVGDTCGACNRAPNCKAGLECKLNSGVCVCGFTCNPGKCQVAPTPAPAPEPAGPSLCFSASATVQTTDRGIVAMKDLAVGDKVLTDVKANKCEDVYAFAHRNPTAKASFLQIHVDAQHPSKPLEMTQDHMLQVNGRYAKAGSVREGDTLQGGQGVPTKVTKIHQITRQDGVYAPLTPSGKLLVDNVLVSAYVSLQDRGNEFPVFSNDLPVPISQQFGIHMILSPYRLLCIGLKMDGICHGMNEQGISSYVNGGIQVAKYADALSFGMQLVLLALAVTLIVPLFVLETLFGARYAPLVAFVAVVAIQWLKKRRMESSKQKSL